MGFTLEDQIWEKLPRPVLPGRPAYVEAYRAAWAIAVEKGIRGPHGAVKGGRTFLDACFSENIFQWDSCFITMWARYAQGALPGINDVMSCLDNFYALQQEDGAIAREYMPDGAPYQNREPDQDTKDTNGYRRHEAFTNPPLFSWAEWEYYEITGDDSRLKRVLPHLRRYFHWYLLNRRRTEGYFWTNEWGCGMDNCPRPDTYGWVDYTSQAAVDAEFLANIALHLEDQNTAEECSRLYVELKDLVNEKMWNEFSRCYSDVDEDEFWCGSVNVGMFWALMAGFPNQDQIDKMISLLRTVRSFGRAHLVPSLAAHEKEFSPSGGYWRGGVWPPTTYMVVRALERCRHDDMARFVALNHLENVVKVFRETGTFWENYAPDGAKPGDPARPDFCGWSALGPIALMIESVLGLRINAPLEELTWHLHLEEDHGVENLMVGPVRFDGTARFQKGTWEVTVRTSGPLTVYLRSETGASVVELRAAGEQRISIT